MTVSQIRRWHVFPDADALAHSVADVTRRAAQEAIATRGRFDIVLAGGTTPRVVYRILRDTDSDWANWHIWFGDERCLAPDDPERNSLMASQAWLDHVAISQGRVHVIPAELGGTAAAAAYSLDLSGVGTFDLVLLGMGEDGHTASLFPGHSWDCNPPAAAIAVQNSPKPPSDRVSLSSSRLSNARQVIFLVTGAGKQHAVQQWENNIDLPVSSITPAAGVDIYVDRAAKPV